MPRTKDAIGREVRSLLSQMTVREKASLLYGRRFWYVTGKETGEDLPEIMVTDGPSGLRKQCGKTDMIGLNDVWRHFDAFEREEYYVSLEEYERNLEQMAGSADKVREFVSVSPFFMEGNRADPMRQMTEQYAAVMKKVADRRGLRFVDMQAAFDIFLQHRSGISISWDRVHPGDTGSMIIARRLLKEMNIV